MADTPAEMSEKELRELFNEVDTDGSGFVDEDEIAAMAKRLGAPLTKRELAEAMKAVRLRENQTLMTTQERLPSLLQPKPRG